MEEELPASVDVVVPVYNGEEVLTTSILRLSQFLQDNLSNPWQITIADNASTDATRSIGELLQQQYSGVNYLYLPQKGRGRALRRAWLDSTSDFVSYMDVDLSTDLIHFPQLIRALESGYHIAVGSRVHAAPMSFAVDGKQYVTIAAGNVVFTFGLPD